MTGSRDRIDDSMEYHEKMTGSRDRRGDGIEYYEKMTKEQW